MKSTIRISLLATLFFMLHSCEDCEVLRYHFPVDVNNTINQNIVPIGESFEITFSISDQIEDTNGRIHNIENEGFDIGVSFQKYVGGKLDDNKFPYKFYEDGIDDLDIEMIEGEVINSSNYSLTYNGSFKTSLSIKPSHNQDSREVKFKVTPLRKDTFVIHFTNSLWDSNRDNKSCFDLNYIKFENNTQDVPSYVTDEFDESEEYFAERFSGTIRNTFVQYDGGTFFIVE